MHYLVIVGFETEVNPFKAENRSIIYVFCVELNNSSSKKQKQR
jgi:hypothetical protein